MPGCGVRKRRGVWCPDVGVRKRRGVWCPVGGAEEKKRGAPGRRVREGKKRAGWLRGADRARAGRILLRKGLKLHSRQY